MNTKRISVTSTLAVSDRQQSPTSVAVNTAGPKILLVGEYQWFWYQEACALALEQLGCTVTRFGWLDDFRYWPKGRTEPAFHSYLHRLQYGLRKGPVVSRINRRLLQQATAADPDIVWFYNVNHIAADTVRKLRTILPNAVFAQYSNDNPFTSQMRRGFWTNYLQSIPHFDLHFSYRSSNLADLKSHGAKDCHLLRSYFIPDEDFPEPEQAIPDRFRCDVVFAGHYEDDGRLGMLESIARAGYRLNIFGGGWSAALAQLDSGSPLRDLFPIQPATGRDYRFAICGAKVALCFLSTLNQDTYTRRNFQIPAMKTAMLSQYTDDLASLFEPDKEAAYFSSRDELLEKLRLLMSNERYRATLAEAGYARVSNDGHDVQARMKAALGIMQGKVVSG